MSMESEETLAFEAMNAGDYERARQLSVSLAKRGSAYAMLMLGFMHDHGRIDAANQADAVAYYRKAGDGGIVRAFYHLGMLLLDMGDGSGAREAFARGAALGSMQSMHGLGLAIEREAGADAETQEALRWFERAAAQGHIPAERRLIGIRAKKSLAGRLMLIPRVLKLTWRGVVLYLKDKHAERLH